QWCRSGWQSDPALGSPAALKPYGWSVPPRKRPPQGSPEVTGQLSPGTRLTSVSSACEQSPSQRNRASPAGQNLYLTESWILLPGRAYWTCPKTDPLGEELVPPELRPTELESKLAWLNTLVMSARTSSC